MKRLTRLGYLAAAFVLLSSVSLAAPRAERSNKYFIVAGQVLNIDAREHTLLIREHRSRQLYLIGVPDGVTFKITFGRYMRMAEPGFSDVNVNERVQIRVRPTGDHLARLKDGRAAIRVTATS